MQLSSKLFLCSLVHGTPKLNVLTQTSISTQLLGGREPHLDFHL